MFKETTPTEETETNLNCYFHLEEDWKMIKSRDININDSQKVVKSSVSVYSNNGNDLVFIKKLYDSESDAFKDSMKLFLDIISEKLINRIYLNQKLLQIRFMNIIKQL